MTIKLSPEAKILIAQAGFDPVYGARPLKRAIYEYVEDKLSDMILSDEIGEGDNLVVNAVENSIRIVKI
jgi:ATP-dependent Clp protease ATP-binding subunit ClpB